MNQPNRLRILRYLAAEPLTPAQLSRCLRLRAPTVTHHLRILRLAGLVQLTLGEGKEEVKEPYAARSEAVAAAFSSLKSFLEQTTCSCGAPPRTKMGRSPTPVGRLCPQDGQRGLACYPKVGLFSE
jgi:hypothetical protein